MYEVLPRGEAPDPADTTCSQYFHIDAAGKACFTTDEALRACERVVEMDLVARVKAADNAHNDLDSEEMERMAEIFNRMDYNGDGELKFVLEDESDVPDWQRRVRVIDETLQQMDEELEDNNGSEFFAWMAVTLNKLKNVARS